MDSIYVEKLLILQLLVSGNHINIDMDLLDVHWNQLRGKGHFSHAQIITKRRDRPICQEKKKH